jgi:beta-phosphoglucomutase-like phosphatase (HAD superfamily)
MKNQLKALIFDVDGTLAETERDGHRVAFNLAFKYAQLDWYWDVDFYGNLLEIAGGKERIKYYLNHYKPNFIPPSNLDLDLDQFIAYLHQEKTKYYGEILSNKPISLRPGIKRLITEARNNNLRLAIATTAHYDNAIALLENSLDSDGINWFEVIGAGDIVEKKKPAPDIYLYVLEKMNLSPDECVVFEDSRQGLIASTQAGIKTIITVNQYTKNQDFSEAMCVVNHLGEEDQPFTILGGKKVKGEYFNLQTLAQLR